MASQHHTQHSQLIEPKKMKSFSQVATSFSNLSRVTNTAGTSLLGDVCLGAPDGMPI